MVTVEIGREHVRKLHLAAAGLHDFRDRAGMQSGEAWAAQERLLITGAACTAFSGALTGSAIAAVATFGSIGRTACAAGLGISDVRTRVDMSSAG